MAKPESSSPTKYEEFARQYPDVLAAYERLGATTHDGGPLDARTRELVKLALAVGAGLESAAHAHTRLALEVGASPAMSAMWRCWRRPRWASPA